VVGIGYYLVTLLLEEVAVSGCRFETGNVNLAVDRISFLLPPLLSPLSSTILALLLRLRHFFLLVGKADMHES
jgi:hypothetical protein